MMTGLRLRFLQQFTFVGLLRRARMFLSYFFLIILAKFLGKEDLGAFSYLQNLTNLLALLSTFGISTSGFRFFGELYLGAISSRSSVRSGLSNP